MKYLTIPRIIGAICVIIAVLALFTHRFDFKVFLLGVIGIMLLSLRKKYSETSFDDFASSFKWQTIVVTALYDALFWMLLVFSIQLYQWRLQVKTLQAQASTVITREALLNPQQLSQNLIATRSFIIFLIVGILLLIIFNLITYTLSRGMIWTNIAGKKPTKKFLLKFLALNSLWWLIWLPMLFIVLISLRQTTLVRGSVALIFMVAAYFTVILHTLFLNERGLASIGHAFGVGMGKLFRFAVPYGYAFIVMIIILVPATLIFTFAHVQGKLAQALSMMLVVPWLAWLRVYLYPTIKKLM